MTCIAITGGPRTGKTTLASMLVADSSVADWGTPPAVLGGPTRSQQFVHHTDDLGPLDWPGLLDEPGPWIDAHEALTRGQEAMANGVAAVHAEIEPWLNDHGITTEYL